MQPAPLTVGKLQYFIFLFLGLPFKLLYCKAIERFNAVQWKIVVGHRKQSFLIHMFQ